MRHLYTQVIGHNTSHTGVGITVRPLGTNLLEYLAYSGPSALMYIHILWRGPSNLVLHMTGMNIVINWWYSIEKNTNTIWYIVDFIHIIYNTVLCARRRCVLLHLYVDVIEFYELLWLFTQHVSASDDVTAARPSSFRFAAPRASSLLILLNSSENNSAWR